MSSRSRSSERDVNRLVRRLQDQNLRVEPVSTSSDGDCAANSHGDVRVWFGDHPCSSLQRVLLPGFLLRRDGEDVLTESWSRIADGSQQDHRVTSREARPVSDGVEDVRRRWMEAARGPRSYDETCEVITRVLDEVDHGDADDSPTA